MNTLRSAAALLLASLLLPAAARAAKVSTDIFPEKRRQITVDTAERLATRKAPESLPADLPSPFSPADFDKPDPSEIAAQAAAGGRTGTPPPGGGKTGPGVPTVTQTTPNQPPPPAGDRETLETLAVQIQPSGSFTLGGKALLVIGGRRFEVGTRFTAAYNNQEYEIELVAIDRTTFTLRYRNEEITRSIKPLVR